MDTLSGLPEVHNSVAVDQQSDSVVSADGEDECLITGGDECAVEAGREVLEIDTRSEDCVAAIAQFNGFCQHNSGDWCACHLYIVIISGLHALTA